LLKLLRKLWENLRKGEAREAAELIRQHLADQLSKIPYGEAEKTIRKCDPRDAYSLAYYIVFNHLKASNPAACVLLKRLLKTNFGRVAEILGNYEIIVEEVYRLNPKLGSLLKTRKGRLFTYYVSYYTYQLLHYLAFGKYRD